MNDPRDRKFPQRQPNVAAASDRWIPRPRVLKFRVFVPQTRCAMAWRADKDLPAHAGSYPLSSRCD
jgi:hypothetical protein